MKKARLEIESDGDFRSTRGDISLLDASTKDL